MQKQVDILVQECQSIIHKSAARCQNENLNNIIFDSQRIFAHWKLTVCIVQYVQKSVITKNVSTIKERTDK